MLTLCFDPETQTCEMNRDGTRTEISISRAKELFDSGEVDDYTLSFHRLAALAFDGEAVADLYRKQGWID